MASMLMEILGTVTVITGVINDKSRSENPQKLTQLSPRSLPRHLIGKITAQKDTITDITSDSQRTVISYTAFLIGFVRSHCSESHRETCSWSYIRLQLINSRTTSSTQYIPDFNATTLRYACDLYHEYSNCSQPFLNSCDTETLEEIYTYENSFGPVCGNLLESYLQHRSCFQRLQKSYSNCQLKKVKLIRTVDKNSSAYKFVLCSSSKDYVMCIYTATALGCSMQAADIYFKLLKRSLSSIFKAEGYKCTIRHPLDVISIYTTTPSTTTEIRSISPSTDNAGGNPMLSRNTSGCSSLKSMQILYCLFCVLVNLIYFTVT